jgi:hypothetical protein
MDANKIVMVADIVAGILCFALALPLILRKVPMNDLYGFRIKAAFESQQRWFDVNAHGGRQMATWSWLLVACGVAVFFVPPQAAYLYPVVSLAITAIAVGVPVLKVLRWSRQH